jgi:hypothetical protein
MTENHSSLAIAVLEIFILRSTLFSTGTNTIFSFIYKQASVEILYEQSLSDIIVVKVYLI